MKQQLSLSTPLFGIPLWVLLVASTAAFIVAVCAILCICCIYYPRRKSYKTRFSWSKSDAYRRYCVLHNHRTSSLDKYRSLLSSASCNFSELEKSSEELSGDHDDGLVQPDPPQVHGIMCHFSLKELEDATNEFAEKNAIGSGDNGTVYRGLLPNNKRVVVKSLEYHSCQPEEFFASQAEAIGRAKHKRLVKLIGYCTKGSCRLLVSEYMDNGNLHQWLHEFPGAVSPLTWPMRLHILHVVAKGLAYLHEEVEPKIIHGSIKSRNILLDRQWNPKISDFGLCKLLSSECSRFITETLGYASPGRDTTNIFTEGNDIYGFGILMMEIISGRIPLRHSQPQAHIVDWFKSMISNGKISDLVDPKLPAKPSSIVLKRISLLALWCVDLDMNPKLKMGYVVQMLETNLLLFYEYHNSMESCQQNLSPQSHTPSGLEDTP